MKINDPESFKEAIAFDKRIRKLPSFEQEQYVHRSCKPLDEVDFDNAEDKGQLSFLDECDGMCGVSQSRSLGRMLIYQMSPHPLQERQQELILQIQL